jgi:ATP-dependent helicase/nuclease subunit A
VQIRTFHSWFAALLRTAPLAVLHELELPSAYELLEDDAPAKALVWRRFFTALVKAGELRNDFEDAVASHGRSQTLKALEAALDKRIEFALADEHGVVIHSVKRSGHARRVALGESTCTRTHVFGCDCTWPGKSAHIRSQGH